MKAPAQLPPMAEPKSAPPQEPARAQGLRSPLKDEEYDERMMRSIVQRATRPVQAKAGAAFDFGYGDLVAAARALPRTPDATGMPPPVRAKMEDALGADFSDVRVHAGSAQAVALGALAFTQGSEIHVAPGHWAPETAKGQDLLGHELGHVLQQRAGRVTATAQAMGVALNDEPALEREADTMGARAAQGKAAPPGVTPSPPAVQRSPVVQRTTAPEAQAEIQASHGFWGTDKERIYRAIRACTDRPALRTAIMPTLQHELSGHDLWKAQLLLEFGNEAAFPAPIQEIWAATEGWGTDEARIYRALQGLTRVQVTAIAAVPGLRDILQSELSGRDLTAANDLLSGSYADAIARHKGNVVFVATEITNMRAPANPPEVKNAAEWVQPAAGGAPITEMSVLTPTHDSQQRAVAHGKEATQRAYFGDRPLFPSDAATYDAIVSSERNIYYTEQTVAGEHGDDHGRQHIWLMDPQAHPAADVRSFLVHEVLHDADRHDREPGYGTSYKSPEESWNRYQTEFRAYWTANFAGVTDVHGSAAGTMPITGAAWDNARQEQVFNHLYGSPVYNEWLKPNYDANKVIDGRGFQTLVATYTRPEGANLINSPRIEGFYHQLEQCNRAQQDFASSPLRELATLAAAFTPEDRAWLATAPARPLQELIKDHLGGPALVQIATTLNGGTAPGWLAVNIAEARSALVGAASFWGTDTARVFRTLGNATPDERAQMKTDPTVRHALFSELSGRDRFQALIMLEYGPLANWPPALTQIWEATRGWGTDEARILRALEPLTRPQVEALARIEGVRELLGDELSGQDLANTNELLSGAYADAVALHERDMTAITNVITTGLAPGPDAAWRAICAKLADASKCQVHAMTATHNSVARAARMNQGGRTVCFGSATAYPTAAEHYDADPRHNDGLRAADPATPSETAGTQLYVYRASAAAAADLRTILTTFGNSLP